MAGLGLQATQNIYKTFFSRHLYLKEICEQEVQLTIGSFNGNIARFSFVFFNIYFYNIYK